jgi:hypothetical protein
MINTCNIKVDTEMSIPPSVKPVDSDLVQLIETDEYKKL